MISETMTRYGNFSPDWRAILPIRVVLEINARYGDVQILGCCYNAFGAEPEMEVTFKIPHNEGTYLYTYDCGFLELPAYPMEEG
jgi:hypothetical protein